MNGETTRSERKVNQIALNILSLGKASLSSEIMDENRALNENVGIFALVHTTES